MKSAVVIIDDDEGACYSLEWLVQSAGYAVACFRSPGAFLDNVRDAVKLLDQRDVDFEYEGEMTPDAALNPTVMKNYPFSRLSGPANVLVMPGLQSANISAKLLRELGGTSMIGPVLVGMEKSVQIATMSSNASELLTLAVLAAGGIAL